MGKTAIYSTPSGLRKGQAYPSEVVSLVTVNSKATGLRRQTCQLVYPTYHRLESPGGSVQLRCVRLQTARSGMTKLQLWTQG